MPFLPCFCTLGFHLKKKKTVKNVNSPENCNKNKDCITWFCEKRAEVSVFKASLVAQLVKNLPAMRGRNPWVGKIPWSRERLPTPVFWLGEFHGL